MTQLSCASDYYAYCSKHAVGSPGVRKCMNDNGARLSNACINALISDGEISKEEVQRRREQALAAKRPAVAPQKPAIAADAGKADALKSKTARVADGATRPAALATEPMRTASLTLTLDQKTFEALKNRGNSFVVNADDVVPTSFDDAPKSAIAAAPARQEVSSDAAGDAATAATTVQAVTPAPEKARPAEDPPGKMALGKKTPVEVVAPPPPVEAVEPPKPSSAETWLNYMKNRFEGGMNYQGVDANF